jgi:hypothetical protein
MPVGGSNTLLWRLGESTALYVTRMLVIFVHIIEIMRTVIHRAVVHCGLVSTTSSRSYVPSSRSERSDSDKDASSFNSEWVGDGRAIVLVLSPKQIQTNPTKARKRRLCINGDRRVVRGLRGALRYPYEAMSQLMWRWPVSYLIFRPCPDYF